MIFTFIPFVLSRSIHVGKDCFASLIYDRFLFILISILMPSTSFFHLSPEIIYLIFEYLNKSDIAYSFFQFNDYFAVLVEYFIGKQLDLIQIPNETIFQYCLSTLLPSIGPNLCRLSIGAPYSLSTYLSFLRTYCPNLERLHVNCCTEKDDIRHYPARLIHDRLLTLTLLVDHEIVGEEISLHLMNKSTNEQNENIPITSSLCLSLPSKNDLLLLKQYSKSSFLADGLYTIQCVFNGQWLTDTDDDLCLMPEKFQSQYIFSVKQINGNQGCLEYQLHTQSTQRCLTVLICDEVGERWIQSSVLLAQRKQSTRSCARFTFEKVENEDQYHIRPCYSQGKRLQVLRKRIVVSLCDNENEVNQRFQLHRIS